MKVLIAPDKFKGTLTAEEAAEAMAEAVRRHNPDWEIVFLPIADGGEGTAALLTRACGGTMVSSSAADPLFRQVRCEYGISPDGHTAFIDSAQASGLWRLSPAEQNPMRTTSRGTGEIIAQALLRRVKRVVVGLGGTATMDAGTGILQALGVILRGEDRQALMPTASNLGRIEYLDHSNFALRHTRAELIFICDTKLPLLEEDNSGGVMRFAKQKGMRDEDSDYFHAAFGHYRNLLESQYKAQPKRPGMAAAGGAAFSVSALYPIGLESGADWVLRELNIEAAIHSVDLVLTGEGQLDETTLTGKCIAALADRAVRQQKPVVAVVGRNLLDQEALEELGLEGVEAILPANGDEWVEPLAAYDALVQATARALRNRVPKLMG